MEADSANVLEPPLLGVDVSGSAVVCASDVVVVSVDDGKGWIVLVAGSLTSWVATGSTLSVDEESSLLVVEAAGYVESSSEVFVFIVLSVDGSSAATYVASEVDVVSLLLAEESSVKLLVDDVLVEASSEVEVLDVVEDSLFVVPSSELVVSADVSSLLF